MKFKKILSSIIITTIMFSIIIAIMSNKVNAVQISDVHLGVIEKREGEQFGYAIKNPNDGGSKLWRIVEYTGTGATDSLKSNGLSELYCLKEGLGLNDTSERVTYNLQNDMKLERAVIDGEGKALYADTRIRTGVGDETVSRYEALLALGDLLYLSSDSAEMKEAYREAIKSYGENYIDGWEDWDIEISEEEIRAVQQAAIWYFTNYGEEEKDYDLLNDAGWLYVTETGSDGYTSITGKLPTNRAGEQRFKQAHALYNYLVKTAIENANSYSNPENLGAPVVQNTTVLNYEENATSYIVGPINISKRAENRTPYRVSLVVKTNVKTLESGEYEIIDVNGNAITLNEAVENGTNFYISVSKTDVVSISVQPVIKYNKTVLHLLTTGADDTQPILSPSRVEETDGSELIVTPSANPFDLALRKYITKINGTTLDATKTRVPSIEEATITTEKTATYKHRKNPIVIKTNDVVTYQLAIYNEGQNAGRATQIIDQLPTGLTFTRVVSGAFEADTSYNGSATGNNKLVLNRKASNEENLDAYTTGSLDSEIIEIECTVTAVPDEEDKKVLTNVAWISKEYDAVTGATITNQRGADIDSEPNTEPNVNKDNMSNYIGKTGNKTDLDDPTYFYKGEQDDDDFEKLVMLPQSFDLKLIKNITEVNGQSVPERLEEIDVSKLNTLDASGNLIKTAEYDMNKIPVGVKKGDIVTYRLRIFNEGTINGYAAEITEDIPEGLEFIWSELEGEELEADETFTVEEKEAIEFNQQYLWGNFEFDDEGEKIVQISTDYLSKEKEKNSGENLIQAFGDNNEGTKTAEDLKFKDVYVKMKVISEDVRDTKIKNEAAITEDTNAEGNPVSDRDSTPEDWTEHPNHEDDEDHDYIVLESFDLALRKFVIAVSKNGDIEKLEDLEESDLLMNNDGTDFARAPQVDTTKLNTTLEEDGKLITTAIYNHTKEPVLVAKNDYVIYMLRVYNEGDINGYAAEIKDHLPPYLEFVKNEFNEKFGWTVSEDGRTVTTTYLEGELINKATEKVGGGYVLSYKEVPIMCKVAEDAKTKENITNIADITKYLDENEIPTVDRDSQQDNVDLPEDNDLPEYDNGKIEEEYYPGQQDDDDFEKVIVKRFDLALRKWVTQAIVIEPGGTTVTNTGHEPYDDPEQVVKVELQKKKLDQVTVKFKYSIRVKNEGDLEGYAKEVTDYIPEGLKFVAEDNPGWTDEGNNVISTRLLENTLLKPEEYADIEVILTWINNSNNMGLKVNTAEISEDYNEYDVPDDDSTPDNKKPGEDDIDDAPVLLSVSTGGARTYFALGLAILVTIAGGVVLIKKYVL